MSTQKSIAEVYSDCTRVKTPMELQEEAEYEREEGMKDFVESQNSHEHYVWLDSPQTKKILLELTKHLIVLKAGFENFGDNFHSEESMKSAGIQAIKLSVAIKQLTKVINYVRTNNTSELK